MNKKIIIPIIAIVVTLLVIIGSSYAYFTSTINGTNANGLVTTASLGNIEYITTSPSASNVLPGWSGEGTTSIYLKTSSTNEQKYYCTVSLLNDSYNQNVYIQTVSNNGDEQVYVPTVLTTSGIVVSRGVIAPETFNSGTGTPHNVTYKIIFKETGSAQNADQAQTIKTQASCFVDNIYVEAHNYSSVSDMTSNSSQSVGDTIKTSGFYSENDGGGAYYEVVDSTYLTQNSLTPDELTIITLDNGLYAKLVMNEKVNLKQFGAKGDGTTDDTASVNLALINSINRTLYVPSGTYMISRVNPKSNTVIIGEGSSSMFEALPGAAVGSDMFRILYQNNITFRNIAISGNSSVNTREQGYSDDDGIHMFDIWESTNINVDNCTFKDNVYAGIRAMGVDGLNIVNSTFSNVDCGLITMGPYNNNDILVENNVFDGHENSEPVSIYGTGTTTNLTINNNIMRNKTRGIGVNAVGGTIDTISITNNSISNVSTGIVVVATNATIKGNTIDNTEMLSTLATEGRCGGSGISIRGSSNVEASNNTARKICQYGMLIENVSNSNIHDNIIEDAGYLNNDYYPVNIRSGNENLNFYNNRIVRNDLSLPETTMFLTGVQNQNVKVYNNTLVNGKITLFTNSENYIVQNNTSNGVLDRGTNNTVE